MDIKGYFKELRFNPSHHLGLGDIRLTVAQQEEILAEIDRLTEENKELKDDMEDYQFIVDEVSKVYMHITDGKLSKPTYYASDIIREHDDRCTREAQEAVEEETQELKTEIDRLTKELEQAEKDYKTLWEAFVGEKE